jgi:hypothetical protein
MVILALNEGSAWQRLLLVLIFCVGVLLIILVPFVIDVIAAHRTWRRLVTEDPHTAAQIGGPNGVQGLSRATMAYGVIGTIGFALVLIVVERPFDNSKVIVGNMVIALTTTLAAITAFYFGSRLASEARRDAARALAAPPAPAATAAAGLSLTLTRPREGDVFKQGDYVIAQYACTPGAGAQITRCEGPVPSGSPLDTSTPGDASFMVRAADSTGQTAEVTHRYSVQP